MSILLIAPNRDENVWKNAFNQFEYFFPEDISSAAGRISKTSILSFNVSGVDDFGGIGYDGDDYTSTSGEWE